MKGPVSNYVQKTSKKTVEEYPKEPVETRYESRTFKIPEQKEKVLKQVSEEDISKASLNTKNYLTRIFKELGCEFRYSSVKEILLSFNKIKKMRPSIFFREYFEDKQKCLTHHFEEIASTAKRELESLVCGII